MKKAIEKKEEPEELFTEAKRYFKNAKETLSKTEIEYGRYKDKKYVKEASAMAYLSALSAIDGYLLSTGIAKDKLPTSIEEYTKSIKKIPHDGKLRAALNTAYENLHILGYYRGGVDIDMIKSGFQKAKLIIDTLSKGVKNGCNRSPQRHGE
ncbi:MAG: DUF5618 family protein [bacterium]